MNSREKGREDSPALTLSEVPTFRVRIGTARAGAAPKVKAFAGRMRALVREHGGGGRGGRGRAAGGRGGSAAASLKQRSAPQRVLIKSRVVRHSAFGAASGITGALAKHVTYLKRRGASEDGEQGVSFDSEHDLTREEVVAFREALVPDRHHFRFIVSPEHGDRLELKSFARDLVSQMKTDLGTNLTWIGVNHYDTDNPHTHLIVRGKDDTNRDLVISRDYLSHGMRLQAGELATLRLGPRLAEEINQSIRRELKADRVTARDRSIVTQAALNDDGLVSALRRADGTPAFERERLQTIARLQYLESLGMAREVSAGVWQPDTNLVSRLRSLSIQGDIIKTMHARGVSRPPSEFVFLDADHLPTKAIVARVTERAHIDELSDREYVLAEARNGQHYYVPLGAQSEEPGREARVGAVIKVEAGEGGLQVHRLSDRSPRELTRVNGITFLDRELIEREAREPLASARSAFSAELVRALTERRQFLSAQGLAVVTDTEGTSRAGLLDRLYERELAVAYAQLTARHGKPRRVGEGEGFRGTVEALEELPSGPHAVIAERGEFTLIPSNDQLRKSLGRSIKLRIGPPPITLPHEPYAKTRHIDITPLTRKRGIRLGGPS